jgi:adenine-specific DNA-methyltransferase
MSTSATAGVKYIGSKGALLDEILSFLNLHIPSQAPKTILDVFTGTTRVAQHLRAHGWTVHSSDLSWASEAYANAFLLRTPDDDTRIKAFLELLRKAVPEEDWITKTYCDVPSVEAGGSRVKMWKPANGKKADGIRNRIAELEKANTISHKEAMILTACLVLALDKVDSSVGVQQAYLKSWASRADNPLNLQDLPYPSGPVGTHQVGDCLSLQYPEATVAYLDPPYSSHSYSTYYHIWDSITRWDKPQVGLKTNRRIDRVANSEQFDKSMVSPWNSKKTCKKAFEELVKRLPVKYVVISYNDESLIPLKELEEVLKPLGSVLIHSIPYKRNIMCQIGNAEGIENPKTENNEVLILLTKP